MSKPQAGFTIVELLVVIVVIAILATISTIAYNGITSRAAEAVISSDLANANKQIILHQASKGSLPTANNCPSPAATEICLTPSTGTTLTYSRTGSPPSLSYMLLASNRGITLMSTGGDAPVPAYGSRLISLTNMAVNGDLSAGQTGWMNYCQGSSQCIFSGGVLTVIADASSRAQARQEVKTSYNDGDRIFYSVRVRKDSGGSPGPSADAWRSSGGYGAVIMSSAQFSAMSVGQFARYSAIRSFVASQGTYTSFIFGSISGGPVYTATVDDLVVVNLTAAFGAGNEPTVAEMDGILSQFSNGYFSGTVTATY